MYCKKTLLSYEDKQVNITLQLDDEEWEGLIVECRQRNKPVEDCIAEACDAMFKLAERQSNGQQ